MCESSLLRKLQIAQSRRITRNDRITLPLFVLSPLMTLSRMVYILHIDLVDLHWLLKLVIEHAEQLYCFAYSFWGIQALLYMLSTMVKYSGVPRFPGLLTMKHSHTHTSEKSVIITSQHVTSEMNCIFLNSVLGVLHFAPSLYFYVKFVGFHSALRFSTLNNTRFSVTVTPTSPTSCLVVMPTTSSFSFCIQELLVVLLLHPRL
jgi:hypothetical protein